MLRYAITKILEVPLPYAFAWLTDFRNEDPTSIGDEFPRHILQKRKDGFVWIQHYRREGVEKEAVRIVTLKPPNAWHNDALSDEKESSFDYRLSRAGAKRTKLTISVKARYKTSTTETKAELERGLGASWDRYKAALERDYASGRAATA